MPNRTKRPKITLGQAALVRLDGSPCITLADDERGNQLGINIQGDKRSNIPVRACAVGVFALGTDKVPNFVNFYLCAV
jgi:hypothetical protein